MGYRGYREDCRALGRVPTAPYCTDEEVQRLRDLWRPDVQANYRPPYEWDPAAGEHVWRADDYDTTQTSMWVDHPMYVIPPDIAVPLKQKIENHPRKNILFGHMGSTEYELVHGAKRFLQRFVSPGYPNRAAYPRLDEVPIRADWGGINFTPNEVAQEAIVERGVKALPHIDVNAPRMERIFDYQEVRVPRYKSLRGAFEDQDPFEEVKERRSREGLLGWTIPRAEKISGATVFSLLLAKNHLVEVHWYIAPAERLSFNFNWPQLTKTGGALVRAEIAELEPLVPEGTNYDNVYEYQPRATSNDLLSEKWRYTDEDIAKTERDFQYAQDRLRYYY